MSVATTEVPGRVVMHGVSWAAYQSFLELFQEQHLRVAYDRGRLEIMSPSTLHERLKHLLTLVVVGISRNFSIPVYGVGSTTLRRENLQRGIEADAWFYIANEPAVRDQDDLDLDVDPPPDLSIEIDVSSTIDDRLPIYAALGVAEIWVWRAEAVRFLLLGSNEEYSESEASLSFPFLKSSMLTQLLRSRRGTNEVALIDRFVEDLFKASQDEPPRS